MIYNVPFSLSKRQLRVGSDLKDVCIGMPSLFFYYKDFHYGGLLDTGADNNIAPFDFGFSCGFLSREELIRIYKNLLFQDSGGVGGKVKLSPKFSMKVKLMVTEKIEESLEKTIEVQFIIPQNISEFDKYMTLKNFLEQSEHATDQRLLKRRNEGLKEYTKIYSRLRSPFLLGKPFMAMFKSIKFTINEETPESTKSNSYFELEL